jgi:hypothetical protein
MKNTFLKLYLILFYFCSTLVLFAQSGPGDDDGTGGLEGGDPSAPIDDYVWFLAVIGLIFVFMKLRAMQKTSIQG